MHDTGKRLVLAALLCMWFLTACSDGGNKNYTISGTVYSAAGNFADSDINDIMAEENIPNNSIEEAQELTSPAVVGGYVNLRGEGDPGLTHEDGDPVDFFAVRLTAGEVVQLVLPDRSTAEIGLYLYDAAGELVASAPDVAPAAALSAESAGDHYIEVRARAGAGAYRLMIGWPAALVAPAAFDPAAEFVPDEVLVRMKTGGVARMPSRHRAASLADDLEMQLLSSGGREGWMRLRMPRVRRTLERLNIPAPDDARHLSGRARIQAQRRDTWRVVQALRHHPDVAHAQPNFIRRPLFIPDDPLFRYQWNHTLINLPAAWDLTRGSAEVIVAVLDTGILMEHPDLRNQLVGGYDFISDPTRAADGDGIDVNPNDPGDHPVSGSYHGTHIAGIIAAETDNGIGLAGVGGDTRIMPVRVLGRGGGTDKDIARAILWAAGIETKNEDDSSLPGAYPRADIINMSFGGAGAVDPEKDVLAQAVAEARAAGVIVIAAAGNDASNSAFYPAAYDGVVSVGAVDAAGRRTPYSNFGAHLDLMAPGGDRYTDLEPDGYADSILSTLGAKGGLGMNYFYGYMEGTSMSAAHVSGVAALMKAVRPGLDSDQFQLYIEGKMITADLGAEHLYGYGLIDAHQAVATAMETDPPPAISVIPRTVRLDAFESTAGLYVREVGAGGLILQGPTVEPVWLSAAHVVGQGGFGRYTLRVDRRHLAGGVHTGTVSFAYDGRRVTVPVTIDVLPDRAASSAPQYIHLIDARTNAIVDQLVVLPRNGMYPFSFSRVSPGSYYLRSSSDINNNHRLKDQGEAVGAYPSLAGSAPFTVRSSMTGLDFVTGFQQWPFLEPAEPNGIMKRQTPGGGFQ